MKAACPGPPPGSLSTRCQCPAAVGAAVQLVQADQQGGRPTRRPARCRWPSPATAGAAVKWPPPSVEVMVKCALRCRSRGTQSTVIEPSGAMVTAGAVVARSLPCGHGSPRERPVAPSSVEVNSTEVGMLRAAGNVADVVSTAARWPARTSCAPAGLAASRAAGRRASSLLPTRRTAGREGAAGQALADHPQHGAVGDLQRRRRRRLWRCQCWPPSVVRYSAFGP